MRGGGYEVNESQRTKTQTSQQVITTAKYTEVRAQKTIIEIISDQIEKGNASCPDDDLLVYETCLVFQSALATWSRLGVPHNCPGIDFEIDKLSSNQKSLTKLSLSHINLAVDSPCFGHLFAVQVASSVPILIGSATRSYAENIGGFMNPGSNAELCLQSRLGFCGSQTAVALSILNKAGFKARPVEFYWISSGKRVNHILPEVLIDGHYRLIDTTYSAYWVDPTADGFELVPTEKVINKSKKLVIYNEAFMPFGYSTVYSRSDFFDYLKFNAEVVRGGVGFISIDLQQKKSGLEDFYGIKNYIGDNKINNSFDDFKFLIKGAIDDVKYRITIEVAGAAFSGDKLAFICVDRSCEPYSKDIKQYNFFVVNPSEIYLKTDMDVAYVVMKSLEWHVALN